MRKITKTTDVGRFVSRVHFFHSGKESSKPRADHKHADQGGHQASGGLHGLPGIQRQEVAQVPRERQGRWHRRVGRNGRSRKSCAALVSKT